MAEKKKKKPPVEFYLYSEGAMKKMQHQQLEKLKQKSGGDPRQKAGTSRA